MYKQADKPNLTRANLFTLQTVIKRRGRFYVSDIIAIESSVPLHVAEFLVAGHEAVKDEPGNEQILWPIAHVITQYQMVRSYE